MRIARSFPLIVAVAAALSPLAAVARQPGEPMSVIEGQPMPDAVAGEGCGCRPGQWQRPPWHGSVHAGHCCAAPACCPGSSVYQAYPFRALHAPRPACVRPPSMFPRLQSMWCEGALPAPIPPVQPHCHHCGAPIEGGF